MRELLAHVQFRGTIRDRSVEPYLRLLKALRSKRRVRGVLLDISSGGGGAIPSTDLYWAVKRLNEVKPVVASIGSIGASGAYMAALGARKIYAYPDSEVGSIGVIFPHLAVEELLAKIGVKVELLHVGRHKDAYQGLRPLTEEERGKLLAVADDSYSSFVELVARERHQPVEQIRTLATGEFWSGKTALKLGLVDALGDREEALLDLARIASVRPEKTVLVSPPRAFLERMMGRGSSVLTAGVGMGVRDAVEDLLLESWLGRTR
ncbi:MAG: signal peptide peptidase SppA [Thermoplasmata archaeon]|nr:signal peptide peptidase SppA [Thermoplasmata archaeon]